MGSTLVDMIGYHVLPCLAMSSHIIHRIPQSDIVIPDMFISLQTLRLFFGRATILFGKRFAMYLTGLPEI